jgi:hypothetical protein
MNKLTVSSTFLDNLKDYLKSNEIAIPAFLRECGLDKNVIWFMQKLKNERPFSTGELIKIQEYLKRIGIKL